MELSEEAQGIVRELGAAINAAIERSPRVADSIARLREVGYEMQLTLKLEIGLRELAAEEDANEEAPELELTDEDLRMMRRMKIKLDPEEE